MKTPYEEMSQEDPAPPQPVQAGTHTPLPWTVDLFFIPEREDDPLGVYLIQPASETLTKRYEQSAGESDELDAVHAENRANAQFICRAVNSHAELLQALRYAAELIPIARQYFPKSIRNSDKFTLENTCATIGKAIARAEGGAS